MKIEALLCKEGNCLTTQNIIHRKPFPIFLGKKYRPLEAIPIPCTNGSVAHINHVVGN